MSHGYTTVWYVETASNWAFQKIEFLNELNKRQSLTKSYEGFKEMPTESMILVDEVVCGVA